MYNRSLERKIYKHFVFYKYFCLVLGLLKSRISEKTIKPLLNKPDFKLFHYKASVQPVLDNYSREETIRGNTVCENHLGETRVEWVYPNRAVCSLFPFTQLIRQYSMGIHIFKQKL